MKSKINKTDTKTLTRRAKKEGLEFCIKHLNSFSSLQVDCSIKLEQHN